MVPFGFETVTLIRRVETTGEDGKHRTEYKKHTLNGCSWKKTTRWTLMDTAKQLITETVCRVPAGQVKPSAGDYMVLGTVKEAIGSTADINAMRKKYGDAAMQITYISDNARPGLPMAHYACRGN